MKNRETMKDTHKIEDKYIKEALEEYECKQLIKEDNSKRDREVCIVNGIPHTKLNITYEEFIEKTNGTNMNDIRWT